MKISNASAYVIALLLAATLVINFLMTATNLYAQAEATPRRVDQYAPVTPVALTDVQLKAIGDNFSVLRLQANGPLAFDRLPSRSTRQVILLLRNTKLTQLPPWDAPQFGTLSWSAVQDGAVTLTVDLTTPFAQATVTQAANPNIVEIRIRN